MRERGPTRCFLIALHAAEASVPVVLASRPRTPAAASSPKP